MIKYALLHLVCLSGVSGSYLDSETPMTSSSNSGKVNKTSSYSEKMDSVSAKATGKEGITSAIPGRSEEVKSKDAAITKAIQQKIQNDKGLEKYLDNLGVYTFNGNVTMTGIVDDKKEKLQIIKLAKEVTGVKDVDAHIEVSVKFDEK